MSTQVTAGLFASLINGAPPVPSDYERRRIETAVERGGRPGIVARNEPEIDRIVRFRIEYATKVIEALKKMEGS